MAKFENLINSKGTDGLDKIARRNKSFVPKKEKQDPPNAWALALATFFAYAVVVVIGHIRDVCARLFGQKKNRPPEGYAPLLDDFDDFYTRRLYRRIQECFNRPICSAPGAYIEVMDRVVASDPADGMKLTGKTSRCLNLSSYNYLGFAETSDVCKQQVIDSLNHFSPGTTSPSMEAGTTELHTKLEQLVARFIGKPAAMVFGMGFATNSTVIPALVGKGALIVSDELNHSSIVTGARIAGAKVRVFRHNNAEHLEQVLREAIAEGQPRTHRPWTKILIIVEGIYSMEGEICCLPEIVAVKKKYKAYLYLDEAHSIGAMGPTGRGVTDHLGVNVNDVDIMMGTFTKSFGSVGGYIAGSESLIEYLKMTSPGQLYASSMAVPCVQQIITALSIVLGEDGSDLGARKLRALRDNSNYFRRRLIEAGFDVYGDEDSPVVPVMLYMPGKMPTFSRFCLENKMAVVVVGFPATPILKPRVRFCISAAHTKEDLEDAMQKMIEIADVIGIRYCKDAPTSY
mmetsp:Transcript_27178/g.46867  ORF Transcript_27178/g.46867 Transcript_27178/m.46867 type:complete len:514 (-) Transcript_27178:369-1910(-)